MNVFVYGSLMYDEVWNRIVAGKYRKTRARLTGYKRYRVKGEDYPGLVRGEGEVQGYIWFKVGRSDLKRLDRFEGNYYRRIEETAVDDNGKEIKVSVYLIKDRYRKLLQNREWDVAAFAKGGLQRFKRRYAGFGRF